MSLAGRALWRLISATLFLLWSVFLAFAAPALARRSSAVERYAGEGRIGADPPFPVHLEVRTNGRSVDGVITSPGAAFKLVGTRGRNLVTGRFSGDGGSGTITLRLSEEGAEGEFLLGEQAGTLWARRTSESAASFFKGPEQKLELTKDQWREDLDKLVEILTSRHGSPFHRTSKQTFYHEVQRVRARIAELTNPQIAVQLARLAALIGDGHTWVASPRGRPRFSLETYWFEDGVRVVGIDPSRKELLGAALVAISDVPTSEVLRRLRAFAAQGETAWSYRSVAPYLLGNPDILEAAGIGSGMSRQFSFRTMDGRTRQITLEATSQRPERLALGGRTASLGARHTGLSIRTAGGRLSLRELERL